MLDQTTFELIIGSTMSDAAVTALGSTEATYISKRNTNLDILWAAYGDGSLVDGVVTPGNEFYFYNNLYDRVYLYYQKWKASGYTDTVSRDRARATAAYYLPNFTNNFTDFTTDVWLQSPIGVALYYCDTGDAGAMTWLKNYVAYWRSSWFPKLGSTTYGIVNGYEVYGYDGRTTGKGLMTLIIGALLDIPIIAHPVYGAASFPGTHLQACRQALQQIIDGRNGDGVWRYPLAARYMLKPFMTGIILDSLIMYNELLEVDNRIVPMIQTAADYLYAGTSAALQATFHSPTATYYNMAGGHTFVYLEGSNDTEDQSQEYLNIPHIPGLEGMLISAYAYVYNKTGIELWKDRTNDILLSYPNITFDTSTTSAKLMNESYSLSYKVFPFLYGTVTTDRTGTLVATGAGDAMSLTGRVGTNIRLNWV